MRTKNDEIFVEIEQLLVPAWIRLELKERFKLGRKSAVDRVEVKECVACEYNVQENRHAVVRQRYIKMRETVNRYTVAFHLNTFAGTIYQAFTTSTLNVNSIFTPPYISICVQLLVYSDRSLSYGPHHPSSLSATSYWNKLEIVNSARNSVFEDLNLRGVELGADGAASSREGR